MATVTTLTVICSECGPLGVAVLPFEWDVACIGAETLATKHSWDTGHRGSYDFHEIARTEDGQEVRLTSA